MPVLTLIEMGTGHHSPIMVQSGDTLATNRTTVAISDFRQLKEIIEAETDQDALFDRLYSLAGQGVRDDAGVLEILAQSVSDEIDDDGEVVVSGGGLDLLLGSLPAPNQDEIKEALKSLYVATGEIGTDALSTELSDKETQLSELRDRIEVSSGERVANLELLIESVEIELQELQDRYDSADALLTSLEAKERAFLAAISEEYRPLRDGLEVDDSEERAVLVVSSAMVCSVVLVPALASTPSGLHVFELNIYPEAYYKVVAALSHRFDDAAQELSNLNVSGGAASAGFCRHVSDNLSAYSAYVSALELRDYRLRHAMAGQREGAYDLSNRMNVYERQEAVVSAKKQDLEQTRSITL